MKYLIISDTHSNLEALRAVMAAADYDKLVFLGDAVDYGPDPVAVVEILRGAAKEGAILVRGNHDEAASHDEATFDTSWWSETAVATLKYTWAHLPKSDRDFLGRLPLTAEVDLGAGGRALACHGSPSNNLEYLWPDLPERDLREKLGSAANTHDAVWVGHSHHPFRRDLDHRFVMNPGSVGQPRDGNWRASFATYDTGEARLDFKRVEYDLDATARKIREREMPLAERLVSILRNGGGRAGAAGP